MAYYLSKAVLASPWWQQILVGLLLILLVIFFGMILRQLIVFSLATAQSRSSSTRQEGFNKALVGLSSFALGVGIVLSVEHLNKLLGTNLSAGALGLFALGLYLLADGLGIALAKRDGLGVVLLIWAIVGGVVWLVV